jgi:LuxR family transcriptional regulator, maltose regulon positive regulatory protein
MPATDVPPPHSIDAGRAALARGAWRDARGHFDDAVDSEPSDPRAWEGRAAASLWLQDVDTVIESWERAFALHREGGDDCAAAGACLELAGAFVELRGEPVVGNGWIQRARRLLRDAPPCRELALLNIWDGFLALQEGPDVVKGRRHARQAVELSEAAGAEDTAVLALALEGLAAVIGGEVRTGMSLLDEAVAVAVGGELTDPDYIYRTCCCMIDACEQVRDYGRAVEWCDRLREVAERWDVPSFIITCRIKYSGVLLWRGEWEAVEAELNAVRADTGALPRSASARLAELRRRQGRTEEAQALLQEAGMHTAGVLVRAGLALDSGDPEQALDMAGGLLRRIPEGARTERIGALEIRLRAEVQLGRAEAAAATTAEMKEIASTVGTGPLLAAAHTAHGRLAVLHGDLAAARTAFEESARLYETSGSAYECARARLELASVLEVAGQPDQAAGHAAAAAAVLEPMGAALELARARALLEEREPAKNPLTARQREVLALVAEGLTDREIGERLFISEYTVHRHVSDILTRLGVSSRTGAAARALREGIL